MQFRNVQPGSPEEILLNVKQGKASYAQIYETLCSYAGLHCRVIRGYAKGADYKPGMITGYQLQCLNALCYSIKYKTVSLVPFAEEINKQHTLCMCRYYGSL